MPASRKILGRPALLAFRRDAAASGLTVVHCHGCFDIVHPGHIHYLQFAKSLGDKLVVTVSADPQVNKGFDRPLIPDDLRAASLAALECVDAVFVNPHPTAVEILEDLRPDVYVKGREYETNADPRFLAEKQAVTKHGGRVVFSSGDVVYSSTALIGSLSDHPSFDDEKIDRFRRQHRLDETTLADLLHGLRGRRMIVVGDYIQDRYRFCDATGLASEGPMMTLRSMSAETYDGGAAVVAAHLAGLGARVTLVTSLPADEEADLVVDRLTAIGVTVDAVRTRRDLVRKTRFLSDGSKLFKLDEGSVDPLDSRAAESVVDAVIGASTGADGVVFTDFGYGLVTSPLLDRLLPVVRKLVPTITADVSGRQSTLLKFAGIDLLCPTERELRQTLNNHASGLNAVAYELLEKTKAKAAIVTLGKQGLCLFDDRKPTAAGDSWDRKLRTAYLPALSRNVVDPLGCGDALLAGASLTLAAGGTPAAAAYVGSLAAAAAGGRVGNHPITLDQVSRRTTVPPVPNADRYRLAS